MNDYNKFSDNWWYTWFSDILGTNSNGQLVFQLGVEILAAAERFVQKVGFVTEWL